ncbi:MAG: cupin domain-containing protein [Melioribacteraceae bacterium]|nr:MAG: cupin domain-containing protein [Melioribacteraceae bacterium]
MYKASTKNSEHYNWGNACDGWHLLKSDNLSVIQEKVPPGCSEVKHYHNFSHQFFYVLKGTATIEIENETFSLNSFEGIEVKPGQAHQLRNESNIDLEFIVVSSPKSHGDRVMIEN